VIGSEGQLKGRVEAGNVVVSGRVEGSIKARRLEIIAGGCVEGDVHTVDLVIEPGGRFNGTSENLAEEPAKTRTASSSSSSAQGKSTPGSAKGEARKSSGGDAAASQASA